MHLDSEYTSFLGKNQNKKIKGIWNMSQKLLKFVFEIFNGYV